MHGLRKFKKSSLLSLFSNDYDDNNVSNSEFFPKNEKAVNKKTQHVALDITKHRSHSL